VQLPAAEASDAVFGLATSPASATELASSVAAMAHTARFFCMMHLMIHR